MTGTRLRALVVDDEPLARRRLTRLLAGEAGVEVVGAAGSAAEARARLGKGGIDVLFLDVQMPGGDGFTVLEDVAPDERPAIVFVTAFDEHALRAFEVAAVDYLLKPFEKSRLAAALAQVRRERGERRVASDRDPLELLAAVGLIDRHLSRIPIRQLGRIGFVRTAEIDWIEAEGNYVRLHVGRERHLVRDRISALAERLDPRKFLRVHRSAIVQLDRVRELSRLPGGDFAMKLATGATVTMSRSFRDTFETAIAGHASFPALEP